MEKINKIAGITFVEDAQNGVYICYVDNFSDELKEKIREMLSGIWHGDVDSQERQQFNYKHTIKRFLERYKPKDPSTKKGMIGELLAHLLIPQYINFNAISIMKNKEENSIRKGFDIVYHDQKSSIWYCEVKSGGDKNTTENIDVKNNQLLSKAETGIKDYVYGDKAKLWDSVLIDVNSTVFDNDKKIDLKKLLDNHHPDSNNRSLDRNVILSSVLYKGLNLKISPTKLKDFKSKIDAKDTFIDLIVFSIQKPTYVKIENFLVEESNI